MYQSKKRWHFLLIALLVACAAPTNHESALRAQLDGMEAAWAANQPLKIADYYTDDGYLLSGDRIIAQGREQINAYWGAVWGKPVSWELTSYMVSTAPETIFQSEKWQHTKPDMPTWEDHDISLPDQALFQYGQSILCSERDGKIDSSVVQFLLVWKESPDGYKIFLDTYD